MDAEVARLNARKGEFGEAYKAREIVGTVDEWNNRTNYALTSRDGLRRGDAVTPEAAQWDGWFHGTQTQKPAIEPIYLAQRPFSEKTGAANLLKHGVGAFNVDATRVPKVAGDISGWSISGSSESENLSMSGKNYARAPKSDAPGRWPANLLHDGSPEVVALFPTPHGAGAARKGAFGGQYDATSYDLGKPREMGRFGDSGSAARFFNSFAPDDIPIAFYAPKASKADRAGSSHPTVKPIALMRHLIRHICPPGGTVLDPFAGSGTTGEAARIEGFDCILMESEPEYVEFLRNRFSQPMPTQDVVKRPAEAKEARQLELFDTPKAAE